MFGCAEIGDVPSWCEFAKRTRELDAPKSHTKNYGRREILSRIIVGGDVLDAPKKEELLPCGEIAEKYIHQLNNFYGDIVVDRYVIMPNHIHIMLFVSENGAREFALRTRDVAPYKTIYSGIVFCVNVQKIL